MKTKCLLLLLILQGMFLYSFSQSKCGLINDTMYFSRIVITTKGYPFTMCGVSKVNSAFDSSYLDSKEFLRVFYNKNIYAANPSLAYERACKLCNTKCAEYSNSNLAPGKVIDFKIMNHEEKRKIKFKDGYAVLIYTTVLIGKFWEYEDLNLQETFYTSLEYPLDTVGIHPNKCIIPYEIFYYETPENYHKLHACLK